MKGDDVGLRQQLGERKLTNRRPALGAIAARSIVGDDFHSERRRHLRHAAADRSEADDAQRLAGALVGAHTVPDRPVVVFDGRDLGVELPREGEDQHEGVLGGRDGGAAGRVDHRDSGRGGGVHIDVVEPDAASADDAQLRASGDELRGNPSAAAGDDGIDVGEVAVVELSVRSRGEGRRRLLRELRVGSLVDRLEEQRAQGGQSPDASSW